MRVELIYTSRCSSIQRLLNMLETAVAEEQLPIPIELVNASSTSAKSASYAGIMVDGQVVCEFACDHLSPRIIDKMRDVLSEKWKELTELPLVSSKLFQH